MSNLTVFFLVNIGLEMIDLYIVYSALDGFE